VGLPHSPTGHVKRGGELLTEQLLAHLATETAASEAIHDGDKRRRSSCGAAGDECSLMWTRSVAVETSPAIPQAARYFAVGSCVDDELSGQHP